MKHILIAVCIFLSSLTVSAQCLNSIEVIDVIDGDTLKAVIQGLPEPLNQVSIRIMGIDTPEKRSKCPNEKAKALLAKAFIQKQMQLTQKITLKNLSWDKYGGRILAEVYFDGHDVAQLMISNHLAIPYHGEKKSFDWCNFVTEHN